MEVLASACERVLRGLNERALFSLQSDQNLLSIADASHAWDAFRPLRILASITYTKTNYLLLKNYFFGQITWTFNSMNRVRDVVEHHNRRLPQGVWDRLRSICLEIGNKRMEGSSIDTRQISVASFEYLLEILLRPDSPLSGITSLELNGQAFEAKITNYRSHRVIGETIRTRYLVIRCFQLVKARPAIIIVLSV